jgi:hypothetical protein
MTNRIRIGRATAAIVAVLSVLVFPIVAAFPAFAATPTITSFSPTSGPVGTLVTISGTNFRNPVVTQVKIGNKSAAFSIDSTGTHISATIAQGTQTGPVQATNADGTVTSPTNFTLTAPPVPTITSFSPTGGPVGTVVTVTGTGFLGASSVKFNGTVATAFTVSSGTQITATVPTGATTGKISVTTGGGTATSTADFTVTNGTAPTITSFTPTFGPAGTRVTITGTNFTGATDVKIGTKFDPAFKVDSGTQITATVQNGAQNGPVIVTSPSGTGTSSTNFTVGTAPIPQITSFTPTSGPVGTKVTLTGTGFTGATSVAFNGVVDTTFKVVSDTQITATVPSTATTGKIAVTGPGGTGTSKTDFVVTSPFISGLAPKIGPWGTQVVISGGNLTGATSVKFNGTTATFSVNSGTQITATVPNGATTGPISVTSSNGTGTSANTFTIKHLRSVSLSLSDKLTASGAVTVKDGTSACGSVLPVKIQHRVNGSWRTVGTATTTGTGSYSIRVSNHSGKFRARAVRTKLANGDVCGRATSGIVFH